VQAARQVVDFLAGRPVPSIVNPDYLARARARADGPDGAGSEGARAVAPAP